MAPTWHEEQFGVCPHGMAARVYCGVCVGEDEATEASAKADVRASLKNKVLQTTVDRQSAALLDAEARNRNLERRLREAQSRG